MTLKLYELADQYKILEQAKEDKSKAEITIYDSDNIIEDAEESLKQIQHELEQLGVT